MEHSDCVFMFFTFTDRVLRSYQLDCTWSLHVYVIRGGCPLNGTEVALGGLVAFPQIHWIGNRVVSDGSHCLLNPT